ncbi:MAG: AI-2E family transporter [Candidatus Spechtbacterales bacterium]
MNKQVFDISTSTIIRTVVVLLAVAFIFSIWQILASVFLAIVIAAAMEPAIRGLSKVKIPRFFSAVIVYLIALLVITSVFYLVLPTLINETRQLSTDLPEGYTGIISSTEQFFGRTPVDLNIKEQASGFFANIQEGISSGASNIFVFLYNLFGGIVSLVLVFVISFYLVLQKNGIEHFLKSIVPVGHQDYAVDLWGRVQKRLGKWFQGQLLLALFAGTSMFVVLWLLGVKYALTIAFMVGVLEIIPMMGPIIGGVIALVLISFQSPMLAGGAIIAYFLIEQIQQNIFMPHVLARAMGLNPIIIIVALLVGAKLIGFWGILLAIPIAVTITEFVRDFKK